MKTTERQQTLIEKHKFARMEADKERIAFAQKWLDQVESMQDGSKMGRDMLQQAQDALTRAYNESDFYNENKDEIEQIRHKQYADGKRLI